MIDEYKTISENKISEGYYTEKRSKFLAFAHHVETVDEAMEIVKNYRKKYLGQINSHDLTNILIVVIRYFGGVKLGTSGLIVAYRTAAADAIEKCEIETRQVEEIIRYQFTYPMMNDVMRIVKEMNPKIIEQNFDNTCEIVLSIRKSEAENLSNRLKKLSFE